MKHFGNINYALGNIIIFNVEAKLRVQFFFLKNYSNPRIPLS